MEEEVFEAFEISYKLLHFLCKSYSVEIFNRSSISVLAGIEKQLKFRETLDA